MVTVIKKGASIEEIREELKSVKLKPKKNLRQFAGTVKLRIDPLEWQKKIRDEWE